VRNLKPGDYVVATVRRPGKSIYDRIGHSDLTTDATYYERGISLLHGFLTERYVDDEEYIIKVPTTLKEVGPLFLERLTPQYGFRFGFLEKILS
jgi:threonine dehydrogenase-like Zn-dependent dehydrogenase